MAKNIRQNQREAATPTSAHLAFLSPDGTPQTVFPADVVTPLRRMLARETREKVFPKTVSLVASLRQEGVTYLSRAFGTVLAEDLEKSVCIVELNWWWPSPEQDAAAIGLSEVITREATLDEAIVRTGKENLSFLPAGTLDVSRRPASARGAALRETIAELEQRYDHLLLDIPAIQATSDAIPLASLAQACCVVVEQGATSVNDIRNTLDQIDHLQVMGVILNKFHVSIPKLIYKLIAQ